MTDFPLDVPDPNLPARTDRLRLRHFKLLDLIDTLGSLTAAAEVLGISQPSATKLLQELESTLRASLVDRGTRGGVLTAAGRRVMERGRVAVQVTHALDQQVREAPQLPVVRLGILRLAGISMVPGLVQHLLARGELPRLQMQEEAVGVLMNALAAGALDAVVGRMETRENEGWGAQFDITTLGNDPYEVACAPCAPWASRRAVRLDELIDAPWIVPSRGTYTRRAFEIAFLSQGMQPPVPRIESVSFHASFAIVAECPTFLTLAPRSSVRYYQALGKVQAVRLTHPFPDDRMILAVRREALGMPAVQAIRRALMAVSAAG